MAQHIVILTGAGVSAESGLGTFRDVDGIWSKFDPMELASPEGFARNPVKVLDFYNARRRNLVDAQPNAAHFALAKLEQGLAERGGLLTLVTQNIDDLHERAGSANVLHMHGELLKARCGACSAVMNCREDLSVSDACPGCGDVGALRPHVVWFGEYPEHLDDIAVALADADMFISIGTSGTVWPAAGFVLQARETGARTVELNLEPSDDGRVFDEAHYGPASEIVPDWVETYLT